MAEQNKRHPQLNLNNLETTTSNIDIKPLKERLEQRKTKRIDTYRKKDWKEAKKIIGKPVEDFDTSPKKEVVYGEVVFNTLPNPQDKSDYIEFSIFHKTNNFNLSANKSEAYPTILRSGAKVKAEYIHKDGRNVLISFTSSPSFEDDLFSSPASELFNRGLVFENTFEQECSKLSENLKCEFQIQGKIITKSQRRGITRFKLKHNGIIYTCIFDPSMDVTGTMPEWEPTKEYIAYGILVDGTFYVQYCNPYISKQSVSELFDEAEVPQVMKKLESLPDDKKFEIIDYLKNGSTFPIINTENQSSFSGEPGLRMKFDICKSAYPEDVQKAIKRTFADSSYKTNQKNMVLQALINAPWRRNLNLNISAAEIKAILDEKYYGLDYLKEKLISKITEYRFKDGRKKSAILIVGPSGVAKTAMPKDLAEAANIPFRKIPLGGCDNPQYISGTPRLYDNCMPGIIMRTICEIGDRSIILLDDVGNMREGKEGDPYTALYNLLDPDEPFEDNMIEQGIDLADTLFILTANDTKSIPISILDRMEIIYVSDYTDEEKIKIAKDFILPQEIAQYSRFKDRIIIKDAAMEEIALRFTSTTGVREITRNVQQVISSAISLLEGGEKLVTVDENNIMSMLNIQKIERNSIARDIITLKKKFVFYKYDYNRAAREKITSLFADYEKATVSEKEIMRKRLFSVINILPSIESKNCSASEIEQKLSITHYGLGNVKTEICKWIAARDAAGKNTYRCLLLDGPYGAGKTSVCQTIADAIGRKFVKISLNGISSPQFIKGYERIISKSQTGQIISELSEAGTDSVLMMLDEIDKMIAVGGSDPYTALLDLLDDNGMFIDTFLGIPMDLSNVLFIATSNDLNKIPMSILDRMEIVHIDGYNLDEKIKIVNDYIIPKKLDMYHKTGVFEFSRDVAPYIVRNHCKAFGMRDCEKAVDNIIRSVLLRHSDSDKVYIDANMAREIMGSEPIPRGNIPMKSTAGFARALAVSGNSGTTFAVEITDNPYGSEDVITGLPKQSTLDSIKISKLLVSKYLHRELPKLHIHFGEGGIEKDGPSAGITIFSAMLSHMLNIPIDNTIGFTGEIDVFGNVWAIGGTKLKLTAAVNEGCKKVFIPKQNYDELEANGELPKFDCEIIPIHHVEQLVDYLFKDKNRAKAI